MLEEDYVSMVDDALLQEEAEPFEVHLECCVGVAVRALIKEKHGIGKSYESDAHGKV